MPGMVEAVYPKSIEMPERFNVSRQNTASDCDNLEALSPVFLL
jgi:hypothetical protein